MFTRADKIVIVALVLLSLAAYPIIKMYGTGGGAVLEIESMGEPYAVVEMNQRETVTVPGALGDSVIEIDENGARFIETAGGDTSCIEQGYVTDAGEMAVCVPNRVLIRVVGKGNIDTDFISR
jgi:hypothetical protein